jgi:hypothetical protein
MGLLNPFCLKALFFFFMIGLVYFIFKNQLLLYCQQCKLLGRVWIGF